MGLLSGACSRRFVLSANTTGVGLKNLTQLGNTSHMQPGTSSPDFIWWRTNSELKFKGLWWSTLASGECKAGERPGSSNASCGWRVVEVLSQTSTPRERTDCGHRTVICRSDGDMQARRGGDAYRAQGRVLVARSPLSVGGVFKRRVCVCARAGREAGA